MARFGRWRGMIPPLLSIVLLLPFGGPPAAAYDGSVSVNHTAFDTACIGWNDPYPHKMVTAAAAAYARLGYATGQLWDGAFAKAAFLRRMPTDWGVYVHSHGDLYWNPDGSRYSGFREDADRCSGNVVYSKEIAAARTGRASNLVVMSTCHLGEANTTMPAAFAIPKTQAYFTSPFFYLGYVGSAYDSDEWIFEQAFWNALAAGRNAGTAFDIASQGAFYHASFDAQWWGSYAYTGKAGPITTCRYCI